MGASVCKRVARATAELTSQQVRTWLVKDQLFRDSAAIFAARVAVADHEPQRCFTRSRYDATQKSAVSRR